MESIKEINNEYLRVKGVIQILESYKQNILDCQSNEKNLNEALIQSVSYLNNLINKINCSNYADLINFSQLCVKYKKCHDAIYEYTEMLSNINNKQNKIYNKAEELAKKSEELATLKKSLYSKYNLTENDNTNLAKNIFNGLISSFNQAISYEENQLVSLKTTASKLLKQSNNVELSLKDNYQSKTLNTKMVIGQYILNQEPLAILKDIGMSTKYENFSTNLKDRGNIIVKTDYKSSNEQDVEKFILAYIFKFIESFPLGSVNIHLFDRNPNYYYQKIENTFKSDNASEETKNFFQIHSKLDDLIRFKDIITNDIFKKLGNDYSDLYSLYKNDQTNPFNLVILKNGFTDQSGYAQISTLETIASLTKEQNSSHMSGFRFLIIDTSGDSDKNLSENAKFQIDNIKANCEYIFNYNNHQFSLNDKKINLLNIKESIDEYATKKSQLIFQQLNKLEKNIISIDDIRESQEDNPGSILYIPVGKSGNTVIDLPFSCKDDNSTVAGQCIGYMVIGASGSGKSSFFHSLILNGCFKYSPNDLQFWLLDFKNGGSSSKYRDSGLPHIKMIAENNKIDDALCLFQMVLEEMERRSRLFNSNYVDNIIDYNQLALSNDLEYLPRIIIAIDEVQEIFREESATEIQKLISSISSRMRSAGMHFVMVAQNLKEGRASMLRESFLPSASGRVCFRVNQDIPRDSGFEDDFIERKQEIANLKTGEAYISYGKDTIKKVKLSFTSPQEMKDKYFAEIKEQYTDYQNILPLIIGSKARLTINSIVQGSNQNYFDELKEIKYRKNSYTAFVGEDAYRMSPFALEFRQDNNSSVLLMGSDKKIASSLCTSIVLSLIKQNVQMDLFNGDRTKIQYGDDSLPHSFMYLCQHINNSHVNVYKPSQLCSVLIDLYNDYSNRKYEEQNSDEDDLDFKPRMLIINDLLSFDSFKNDDSIKLDDNTTKNNNLENFPDNDGNIFNTSTYNRNNNYSQSISVQEAIVTLLKYGYKYNIYVVLSIQGDTSVIRNYNFLNSVSKYILFNTTDFTSKVDSSYILKEMLKNISNGTNEETMSVWHNSGNLSKLRPIIYDCSNSRELNALNELVED